MTSLQVLVIEDSEDDFGLLVRELSRGRYDLGVKRVQTAFEFAEALEKESWGIVLSDWSMPGFCAIDALQILKSELLDLPFIIVSDGIDEGSTFVALRSGAHDVLSKRQLTRLLPVIARELQESQLRRKSRALQDQLTLSERLASSGLPTTGHSHHLNEPLASAFTRSVAPLQSVQSPPSGIRASGCRSSPASSRPGSGRRGRVLIIDDDVLVLRCLQRTLVNDHEVVALTRGAEAARRVAAGERFDIIVCDLMMPEMTGMDLHARLSLATPEQADRMVFMTGGILSPSVRRFLDKVPNLLLEKPFDPFALRATISERVACLGERPSGTSARRH